MQRYVSVSLLRYQFTSHPTTYLQVLTNFLIKTVCNFVRMSTAVQGLHYPERLRPAPPLPRTAAQPVSTSLHNLEDLCVVSLPGCIKAWPQQSSSVCNTALTFCTYPFLMRVPH